MLSAHVCLTIYECGNSIASLNAHIFVLNLETWALSSPGVSSLLGSQVRCTQTVRIVCL